VGREEEAVQEPRGVLESISDSLDERPWWERFKEKLEIANIERPAIQVAAFTVLATLLTMLLIGLVTYPILVLVALVIPYIVRALIDRQVAQTQELFAEQLADNLQVVVSAVRAGQSFVGALTVVAAEASEPSKEEFQRVVNDERLGVPVEAALRDVARRMASRDMEQVALVATIQREVGGNTAEVLERVIQTVRERADLRRLMETLTAQGRLSRWIVSALPAVLLLAISLLNPGYVKPLYTTTSGQILLGVAAAMVITASLIIRRIVEVKV
jgi:tight adherence protein B